MQNFINIRSLDTAAKEYRNDAPAHVDNLLRLFSALVLSPLRKQLRLNNNYVTTYSATSAKFIEDENQVALVIDAPILLKGAVASEAAALVQKTIEEIEIVSGKITVEFLENASGLAKHVHAMSVRLDLTDVFRKEPVVTKEPELKIKVAKPKKAKKNGKTKS